MKQENHSYIDSKENVLYYNQRIIAKSKIEKELTTDTLFDLVFDSDLKHIFICSESHHNKRFLYEESIQIVRKDWLSVYSKNISFDEEFYLDEYPNGYVYTPEIWMDLDGDIILVLSYYH